MEKWEKGCLFFLQIAVATWFPPYHCGFSFFFPTSIHQQCLAAQSPHYHFKFMEETNRRKSWQHRTLILLPKSKAEHICENKALLDTFNNMLLYLYGGVKNVFYLNPTARLHLLRSAATVCALHRTWHESSSRCQSDCCACSASALPSRLQSPDTPNYPKFPGRNKWTSRFTLHFPGLLSLTIADGLAVPACSQTWLQLHTTIPRQFW